MRDLPKNKLAKLAKALGAAQAAFRAEVEKLADEARAEILPYFKKRNYDYTAGNGTWLISKQEADNADYYKPELHVEDEELPQNIRELLSLEVDGHACLGFYVRDIKRGEW